MLMNMLNSNDELENLAARYAIKRKVFSAYFAYHRKTLGPTEYVKRLLGMNQ